MILSPNSLADSKVPRRVPPADHAVQLTPRWSLGFPEADGMGPSLSVTYSGENQPVILSVCQAVRRAAHGRLQLHTYAHNMQTKNLKALCYKAA